MSSVPSVGGVNITLGKDIFLETLIGAHLPRKFPAFYGTRRFITVFAGDVSYLVPFSQAFYKNIFSIKKKFVRILQLNFESM
jgi:hypothetical protein